MQHSCSLSCGAVVTNIDTLFYFLAKKLPKMIILGFGLLDRATTTKL